MRQLLPPVSCHEAARRPAGLREDAPGEQYCERAGAAGTVRACLHLALHLYKRMRPSLPRSSASARCASCSRWSAATRPRAGPAGPKHKMPMVLLASQELAARAATRDQHLLPGAQTFVPENTSNIWVLTWQRPLKTIRGCILYC